MMAMNCSMTRHRISACDRLGLPPRIMFHRPSSSTSATAASARGTSVWARSTLAVFMVLGVAFRYHRLQIAAIIYAYGGGRAVASNGHVHDAMKSMRLYDRVERLLKELEAAGFAADQPLTVDDLAPFDHLHYCGTTAVDRAIRDCRIATGDNVVEIGSGVGGPARWIAAKTGAAVTALELQPDLDALATTLTARTGLDGRVRHLCANILDGPPAGAPFDHAVSFLCFLHIPHRRRLFSVIAASLAAGGFIYIEDFIGLRQPSAAEAAALANKFMCPYLPDRDRYAADLAEAGFDIVDSEDQTAIWREFTAGRLSAFRTARTAKVAMLGAGLTDGLEDFYATVAHLFAETAGHRWRAPSCSPPGALSPSDHDHLGPDMDPVVEIDHLVIEHADAARGHGLADGAAAHWSRGSGRACPGCPGRDRAPAHPARILRPARLTSGRRRPSGQAAAGMIS